MADSAYADLIDDLEAEQVAISTLVANLTPDDWLRPTPAWSWDVRDTIAHLAHTDELAIDTCRGGPNSLNEYAAGRASPEDTTFAGVLLGRRLTGADVFAWWERAQAGERDVLAGLEPGFRVPWGLGMSPPAFVTARMMETWAHGIDVFAALHREPTDTDRLRHVAWIGARSLPYAFSVAGLPPPHTPLRIELTLPSGAIFVHGPEDAADRVTGPAGEFCRVVVQRLAPSAATQLIAQGDGARLSLQVARSFL